jgi:hypothetical protein
MTKTEMTQLLRSVGVNENTITAMENAYDMGVEHEREACANLIEAMPCDCCWPENAISIAEDFSDAIRERGEA